MILGTGAGIGFILTCELAEITKILLGIPVVVVFIFCCNWAITTYIRIKKPIKQ